MPFKRFKKSLRRLVRRQKRQVEDLGQITERGIERNLFRRFGRLRPVRRFVFSWVALSLLIIGCLIAQTTQLNAYYQTLRPVPGGIYNEGITGTVSNVNPIYAASDVDTSLAHLLFAGLLTYDSSNNLVGNLASGYKVADDGKTYTVALKHGLSWQDGRPLTSADAVFTYQMIKDPDAQSPLLNSWRGVTVTAPDAYTVTFNLPSPLASFPYNLTTGLLPQHILGKVRAADMRSADFNTTAPVGAGPFAWRGLQLSGTDTNAQEQVALTPFAHYAGGAPKLSEFIMHAYASTDQLTAALSAGQLTAAAGLQSIPTSKASLQTHNLILTAGTYVFFKTSSGVLADTTVRQALAAASDPGAISSSVGYLTHPVNEPLLTGQTSYNKAYAQKTNDLASARSLLASDGWTAGANGVLQKNGQPLSFNLVATDTAEYSRVTSQLKKQWQAIGVRLNVELESAADYATTLAGHDYDATLYGISIGQDPDVFVYWDSSQADVRSASRLNLSEWKNTTADTALEAGRTRLDPQLRAVKYAPFLQAWQQDVPAIGLYQPRYLYVTHGTVYGLPTQSVNDGTDRYDTVQHWEVRTARVTN